jgi:flagellar assembly protein FliH
MLATREAIVGTVTTVLSRVKEDREVTIRISAEDLPVLQMEEQRLAHLLGRRKFALVADARITVGGCIVETSLGSLDGRLDVQLREMCETLRSAKAAMREPA